LTLLRCAKKVDIARARKSIGTLGGGNHFIELNKDDSGNLYLAVHSGSRHLGVEVAKHYQNAGYKELTLAGGGHSKIPFELAYVTGALFDDYLHDMQIVQKFAVLNRKAMLNEIVKEMKLDICEEFTTIHNYIDTKTMILRKGAVSAQKDEKLLIPINMRDGSLICIGNGNADWNYSAPHGAGRLMSRTEAKQSFTLAEFKKQMGGVYSTSVNKNTLDECPMAYKNMSEIIKNIENAATILKIIKPIYNFKAAGG
jgi:RNA-splicing ligase RtcB